MGNQSQSALRHTFCRFGGMDVEPSVKCEIPLFVADRRLDDYGRDRRLTEKIVEYEFHGDDDDRSDDCSSGAGRICLAGFVPRDRIGRLPLLFPDSGHRRQPVPAELVNQNGALRGPWVRPDLLVVWESALVPCRDTVYDG